MTKSREKVYFGNLDTVGKSLGEDGLKENPHGEWVVLLSKKV
jgi:16S rRNA C1402 (ribose-2'-O) methylase RsmI